MHASLPLALLFTGTVLAADADSLSARHVDVAAMHARAAQVERRLAEETDLAQVRQYRVLALSFTAAQRHERPWTGVELEAVITAPSGAAFVAPGFYDGDGVWKVRFMPYETGIYRWRSSSTVAADDGLHGVEGTFTVASAPRDGTTLARHGGHLRVGGNRRHLTHTDGTPFFWLGDTWWFVPTSQHPYQGSPHAQCSSMYQLCVQLREKQGYNMLTTGFLGERSKLSAGMAVAQAATADSFHGKDDLFLVERWTEGAVEFWRDADRYLLYAEEAGMGMTTNLIWGDDLIKYQKNGLDHQALLDLVWPVHRYVIARLGSYSMIWHVMAEYNNKDMVAAGLVPVAFALARRMRELDPYRDRPMTIFTWPRHLVAANDAWAEPWHGFKLYQGGHYNTPWRVERADMLCTGYLEEPVQPVLIGEHNFERIFDKKNDAGDVRAGAWRAMLCGSCGVTYGATGLWFPNRDEQHRVDWAWGNNAWHLALDYPGAGQLGELRRFFEGLRWWEMRPLPDAVKVSIQLKRKEWLMPTAAAYGERSVVCYIPGGLDQRATVSLDLPAGSWTAHWIDPRSGVRRTAGTAAGGATWDLPPRPDAQDWALLAEGGN